MIWLILLGILLFYGGYILSGLLTQYKDERIRELERLVAEILEKRVKRQGFKKWEPKTKEEAEKTLEEVKELHERVRPQSKRTH